MILASMLHGVRQGVGGYQKISKQDLRDSAIVAPGLEVKVLQGQIIVAGLDIVRKNLAVSHLFRPACSGVCRAVTRWWLGDKTGQRASVSAFDVDLRLRCLMRGMKPKQRRLDWLWRLCGFWNYEELKRWEEAGRW